MQAIMTRGANVSLTREVPTLTGVVLGVTWNAGLEKVLNDNLVVATILCGANGRALSLQHFIFFNQLASPDLSVHALSEALGGDQEQVEVDLSGVPPEVERVVVILYVNEGPAQRRTLGQLKTCVIRVLDLHGNNELVRSEDLAPALTSETSLALGELYRRDGEWKFKVLGTGYAGGIAAVAADYGLPL
jgi:tellurium resistance protein TerD